MALEGRFPLSLHTRRPQDKNKLSRYAICAVPMGWISAVGLCQHAHRQMLVRRPRGLPCRNARTEEPLLAFEPARETRKDRALPLDEWFYRVYIDNYDEVAIFPEETAQALVATQSGTSERTLRQYDEWGAVGNPDKDLHREFLMESLGYRTDGLVGRQDLPLSYLRDPICLTFWLCVWTCVRRREGKVLAGRWVRAQQVRRATSG